MASTELQCPPEVIDEPGLVAVLIEYDMTLDKTDHEYPTDKIRLFKHIPITDIHPRTSLGGLGFTKSFFERVRNRKVAVIAHRCRDDLVQCLQDVRATVCNKITPDDPPSFVLLDQWGLNRLQHTRGVRRLVQLGTEFWLYERCETFTETQSTTSLEPQRVFNMQGGMVLFTLTWMLEHPYRAMSLILTIANTPGWSAYTTVQTCYLLGQFLNGETHERLELLSAASILMNVLRHLDILFPLVTTEKESHRRLEGYQAMSMTETPEEKVLVAGRYLDVGIMPSVLSLMIDRTKTVQVRASQADEASMMDLRARAQRPSKQFKRLVVIAEKDSTEARAASELEAMNAEELELVLDQAEAVVPASGALRR